MMLMNFFRESSCGAADALLRDNASNCIELSVAYPGGGVISMSLRPRQGNGDLLFVRRQLLPLTNDLPEVATAELVAPNPTSKLILRLNSIPSDGGLALLKHGLRAVAIETYPYCYMPPSPHPELVATLRQAIDECGFTNRTEFYAWLRGAWFQGGKREPDDPSGLPMGGRVVPLGADLFYGVDFVIVRHDAFLSGWTDGHECTLREIRLTEDERINILKRFCAG